MSVPSADPLLNKVLSKQSDQSFNFWGQQSTMENFVLNKYLDITVTHIF